MKDLRPWQQDARRLIAEKFKDTSSENVILLEVGIGSGKTLAALIAAKDALDAKIISRIVVVTFTSHLVRQWGKVATFVGLNLLEFRLGNSAIKNGFPIDADGYITTFASIASAADLHESLVTGVRTVVIIDEIHHLGEEHDDDENSTMTKWAEESDQAFKNARLILALSGTPYRTDKNRIPFVQYEPNPVKDLYKLKSDLTYTYGQSVFDGICRRVVFETLDGEIDVNITPTKNGVVSGPPRNEIMRFATPIDPERWGERLSAALIIDNEYEPTKAKNQLLIELLYAAINKLLDIRLTDARAGCLFIAGNKDFARRLKVLIKQMTGHDAILVLEDITDSSEKIETFRDGDSPFIIAVNMVTEGVDIPRLRVCAYLSPKTAWLYFMQVVGRIVRDPPGQSYFFCYPDPRFLKIIKKIEEELEIWLGKKKPTVGPPPPGVSKIIELNKATGGQWAGMVAGEPVTAEEMEAVDAMRHAMPGLSDADYLVLLQMARKSNATNATKQQNQRTTTLPTNAALSYTEQRDEIRKEIQKKVGLLNRLRPNLPHNDIHATLNKEVGARGKDAASLEQLQHMLALVREWIVAAERTNGDASEAPQS